MAKRIIKTDTKRALILVSGGPDSATLARVAEQEGTTLAGAVYLRTGSKTDDKEIAAAKKVAQRIGLTLEIIDITDVVGKIGVERIMPHANAPIADFGLAVSLSIASAYAKQIFADAILIALHKDDACLNVQYGQGFLDKFNDLAEMARTAKVVAPFLSLSKAEVFELGLELNVDYSSTWSCSENGYIHCGSCGACQGRKKAFRLNNVSDPTKYGTSNPEELLAVSEQFFN